MEKLNAPHSKMIGGKPVDMPMLRSSNGILAFSASDAALAMQACRESERQSRGMFPGVTLCIPPATEHLTLSVAQVNRNIKTGLIPQFGGIGIIILITCAASFLTCFAILRTDHLHGRFSHDSVQSGPQKFHAVPTPRVGGLAIVAGLACGIYAMHLMESITPSALEGVLYLTLAAVPAFACGLAEDLTKKVGVLFRLAGTLIAGVAAALLVGAVVDHVEVPAIDYLLQLPTFAIVFTAFAVGGVANAINIIDGYNGLAIGYVILALAAIAVTALLVGDAVVLGASSIALGALLGMLRWNYPAGRIFLGDGGAYLAGFWLAELCVLLVTRNPVVSPWYPMALLAYPVFETFFSMYRRKMLRGTSAGHPDALHLHQLIYLRLVRIFVGSRQEREITRRNSGVAKYIWAGNALLMVTATLFYRNTPALITIAVIFCCGYLWLYMSLIRWRAPMWLIHSKS